MVAPENNTLEYADDEYDQEYYEEDYYLDEVAMLRQQLDEALRANEALTRQAQEAQQNPPGKSKKKASKRKTPTNFGATMIQVEPRPQSGPVTRQAARAATETQPQIPELLAPQGAR